MLKNKNRLNFIAEFIEKLDGLHFDRGGLLTTVAISILLAVMAFCVINYAPLPEKGTATRDLTNDYHPDEGMWIVVAKHYYQKLFLEGDCSRQTWEDERFGDFGRRNPVLGKYLYGARLFNSGVVDRESSIPGYEMISDQQVVDDTLWTEFWNLRPADQYLNAARSPARWMGILAIVIMFLLVRELTGSWVLGVLSASFMILQPLMFIQSRRAMMDMPAVFFSLVALLVAALLFKNLRTTSMRAVILRLAVVGLFCGIALQTKLNTLLVCFTIFTWFVLELLWENSIADLLKGFRSLLTDKQILKRAALGGLVLVIITMLVFVLLNPFLYRDTWQNMVEMFLYGSTVTEAWEINEISINNTLRKKVSAFLNVGLHQSSIARYWLHLPSLLDKGLVLAGLLFGAAILWRPGNPVLKRGIWLLGIWGLFIALGLIAWVPFKWVRWYVPMTPIWAFLEAFGLLLVALVSSFMLQKIRAHWTQS